jgi:hypothetical protein
MGINSREIRLKSRPSGMPEDENFELAEVKLEDPREGEVLVKNHYISVDPYMRGRMNDRESYVPPFQIGKTLEGGAVGQVVESKSDQLKPGDYVQSMLGWREYYLAKPEFLARIDPDIAPIQAYLSVLGLTGMTAYNGLLDIGRPVKGETLFVSAASGAVGSVVCQIGKIKGCRVVGSAGSPGKTAWLLEEAGIDAVLNYKQVENLYDELAGLCPQGIDVYYENVGGAHLEAALALMNNYGRIVLCGMISQYNNTTASPGPRNLGLAIGKRLTIRGFIASDYEDRMPQFLKDMGQWIKEDKIKWKETIVEGIENAPQAFIGLFKGDNFGKMLVKLDPEG